MSRPTRHPRHASRARQRGAALLVFALLVVLGGAWMGLRILGGPRAATSTDAAAAALVEARDALIGASMAMTVSTVTSPGRLPLPDFLDPVESPANNYDGNPNVCARSTWAAGAALPSIPTATNIRCLGRVPWAALSLGRFGSVAPSDPTGAIPWYAMSANLMSGCRTINPDILNTTYTGFPPGTCSTVAQPFPWLTVRDYKGNIKTTRAAFVLILPGPALGAQSRGSAPLQGPAAYLDTVTVTATCSAPCVPGTYSNARFNWPDNVGLSFIECAPPGVIKASDPSFTQPYACNDRILYVTIDELMEHAERRAVAHAAERLQRFYAANLFFPYAAPHDPAAAGGFGQCQNGLARGLVPHVAESNPADVNRCTHPALTLDTWFVNNNWGPFIYYAVTPDCTQASPAANQFANCGAATTRLAAGAFNNARAIVIGAGAPIASPPFAVSKGAAQTRPSASVADYLDTVGNTDGDNRFDAPSTPLSRSSNDKTLVVAP